MSAIVAGNARARLKIPAGQVHPVGSSVDFYENDGAGGAVDYGERINPADIPLWPPDGAGKAGYGRGGWSAGGYGRGAGAKSGYGAGGYGQGGFGSGGSSVVIDGVAGLLTAKHSDATWIFGAKITDPAGNQSAEIEQSIALAGEPEPPTDLSAVSYAGGVLTIDWTLSSDDR